MAKRTTSAKKKPAPSVFIVKMTGGESQAIVLVKGNNKVPWVWSRAGVDSAHAFPTKADAEAAAKTVSGVVFEINRKSVEDGGASTK